MPHFTSLIPAGSTATFLGYEPNRLFYLIAVARAGSARKGQGGRASNPKKRVRSTTGGFSPPRAADAHDKGGARGRNRQAAGASIPWPPAGPGARGRVPRASSGPATGAPRAGSARRAKVPGAAPRRHGAVRELAARLSAGFRRPHAGVGAGVTRTRVRSRTATARFGCRDAGQDRDEFGRIERSPAL